jgi:hypothetical protein
MIDHRARGPSLRQHQCNERERQIHDLTTMDYEIQSPNMARTTGKSFLTQRTLAFFGGMDREFRFHHVLEHLGTQFFCHLTDKWNEVSISTIPWGGSSR